MYGLVNQAIHELVIENFWKKRLGKGKVQQNIIKDFK